MADSIDLLHLVRVPFHNKLVAQGILCVAGLAGWKNMWCCVIENGIIISLFKHDINPHRLR